MRKTIRAFGLASLALTAFAVRGAAAESSCVDCHRGEGMPAYTAHGFTEWEKSIHAESGVGCESCHGGDRFASDKFKAHAGVRPSTMKDSGLYFTNIPETCGACHQNELKAFKASAHYKELNRTGKGPNCVTCHGSMASHVLAPREMEMTCTLCHRKPTQAYAARMGLEDSGSVLRSLERAVHRAKNAGLSFEQQERAYEDAYKLQSAAEVDWHSFDMVKVLAETRDVQMRAGTALRELNAKQPKP